MEIVGRGWELLVRRTGVHRHGSKSRTYGDYQVFLDGAAVSGLSGNMCECIGPGDNKVAENSKRVEQGRYPLWTQFGKYRSIGYSSDTQTAGDPPMPALRLEGTNKRTGHSDQDLNRIHSVRLWLSGYSR